MCLNENMLFIGIKLTRKDFAGNTFLYNEFVTLLLPHPLIGPEVKIHMFKHS